MGLKLKKDNSTNQSTNKLSIMKAEKIILHELFPSYLINNWNKLEIHDSRQLLTKK